MEKAVMKFYIKPGNESTNQRITYIAVKPYHGKDIKGYAKCAISDQFDNDFGRELAAYRCERNVLVHRIKYARKMYQQNLQESADLEKRIARLYDRMDAQRKRLIFLKNDIKQIDSDIEGLISKKYGEDL